MTGTQTLKLDNQNPNKKTPKNYHTMPKGDPAARSDWRDSRDTATNTPNKVDTRSGTNSLEHNGKPQRNKNTKLGPNQNWPNRVDNRQSFTTHPRSNLASSSPGPRASQTGNDSGSQHTQHSPSESHPNAPAVALSRAAKFKLAKNAALRRDQRPRVKQDFSPRSPRNVNSRDAPFRHDSWSPQGAPNKVLRNTPQQHKGPRSALQHPKGPRSAPQLSKGPQGPKQPNLKKTAFQKTKHSKKEQTQTNRVDQRPKKRPREDHIFKPKEVWNRVTYEDDGPLKFITQVGQGTYGKVYKAMDKTTSQLVAMKRLRLETQHEGFPVTAAREIKLLQVLDHPNIVRLSEIVVSRNDIYMALDYIEHDLAGLLLNSELEITAANTKSIMKQTLTALAFLHSQHILHRDIKGSNLLVTADGTVKLADFGLARYTLDSTSSVRYTNRVITLWYRPPELLMGAEHYGSEVDTWGAGCLLVEMFNRAPLFYGKDEVTQIQAIYSIMGVPTMEDWPEYTNLPWYYMISSLPPTGSVPAKRLHRVFSGSQITPACFDIASKLLSMNPAHRLLAADALQHEYFLEEPKEEPLNLHSQREWHDWEAKKRKRSGAEPEQA